MPIHIITSGNIATLGKGDNILHTVRVKYLKFLNLSHNIKTIIVIIKETNIPNNTILKELSTCIIILPS